MGTGGTFEMCQLVRRPRAPEPTHLTTLQRHARLIPRLRCLRPQTMAEDGETVSGSAKGQPTNWRKAKRLKALEEAAAAQVVHEHDHA